MIRKLAESHIGKGLRTFGEKAWDRGNLFAVDEGREVLSIVFWKGRRWWLTSTLTKKGVRHDLRHANETDAEKAKRG